MRRAWLCLLLLLILFMTGPPSYALDLNIFGSRDRPVPKVKNTVTEIPFATQDEDAVPKELKSRIVSGQAYYAAVEVRMGAGNYFPAKCDDNAAWRYLRLFGVDKDGTYSVTGKFTVGNAATEDVPLFLVTKAGNSCTVQATISGGVQVTPFSLLDSSKTINVRLKVRYKQDLTFEVAKKWFGQFYNVATAAGGRGGLNVNPDGITLKQPAVLSDAEYKQIEGATNGEDAQLNSIFGTAFSSQNELDGLLAMRVEYQRGVWLHTGLGGEVNTIAGLKSANIALVIRPRISLFVDNQLVQKFTIGGVKHLVPNFKTLGNSVRGSKIFYSIKTKALESLDTLKEVDEALKEKVKNLPAGSNLSAWGDACDGIQSYLQRQYGLNDYDALAIAASLFVQNLDLDKDLSFAKIGCRKGVPISDFWPKTGFPENEETAAPANCWNDMAQRAIVRNKLDETVIDALAGRLGSSQEERARILNQHLTPGAVLDDPHDVASPASNSASIADRLRDVLMEGHGFCYDSAEDLSSPLYQRGFLMRSGSQILRVAFEFDDLCNKALSGRTPQVNRMLMIRLRDDDDEGPASRTVERLINFNRPQCTSCMKKLKAALPQTYGRFQIAPACQ
ncbi:MAG: hypothetical protein ACOZAM_00450 [Pseudomonadota bacterium]